MPRGKRTDEFENEPARLNLKTFLDAARAKGPMSLNETIALCELANKEFNRGSTKQS